MNNVELSYSSSNPLFEHIDRPGLNVKLSTPPHTFLFATPIGKSFECMQEQTIVMYSQVINELFMYEVEKLYYAFELLQDENDKSGHLAKLYLRDTRMQAFMYRAGNQWGKMRNLVC